MSVIDTNLSFAIGVNYLRQSSLSSAQSLQKLSTGSKINFAADDPSGLAISKGMETQIRSIRAAIQNSEDTISLIQTADGALSESHDILLRMRDIAVRAANEPTLTPEDGMKMHNEFASLAEELNRKATAVTFNKKTMIDGTFFTPGQVGQIGPDNGTQYRALIDEIIGTDARALGVDGAGGASVFVHTASDAQAAIDAVANAIESVSNMRSNMGVMQRQIAHSIDDLMSQDINIAAARSRISDIDMALEIVDMTKIQILQQSSISVLAQSNAPPMDMLRLLG